MNHYLAVSPGKTVLRPLAKNILRAAALVEAIPVQFSFSGRAGIALSTGEPFPPRLTICASGWMTAPGRSPSGRLSRCF